MDGEVKSWVKVTDRLPPANVLVETMVDDGHGVRNVQTLRFHSNLWWCTDGSDTYVYYTPTHWRLV